MEKNINLPKIGMNLSKSQQNLEQTEYSLLVNGNIQNPLSDTYIVTNEQSNLLCSRFKPGFKVIGILPINVQNRTVFFLVNPLTNQSEIGYINNVFYEDVSDPSSDCGDCKKPLKEEELNTLILLCNYTTIVNASCLNFNINYPIISTYSIGVDIDNSLPDNSNTTIFFTDFLNKRRYVNITNYPRQVVSTGDCNQPIYNNELDCNAIKIVPEFKQPCISIIDTPIGGSNKAGVYQFCAAYTNVEKQPLTDYSSISNPVSLFSEARVITVNKDYNTNKAIKLEISNVDQQFKYLNIVVLKTINSLTEAFIAINLPVNSDVITYTYTGDNYQNEPRITLDELQRKRAIYEYAEGVATANKHLFWWGLKDQREINLQPVISEIPLQWQTVEAAEGFYGNPLSADFVSYERDEVVPFGIEFRKTNGYKTPTFLFVGRDKDYFLSKGINVDQPVNNKDAIMFPSCNEEETNKLWQVYNLASVSGESECYSPTGTKTITEIIRRRCVTDTWIDGETPETPCITPSGNCEDPNSVDYKCCSLVTVTPSGEYELPVYNCNTYNLNNVPCVFAPGCTDVWTNIITGEVIPDNAGVATWTPQNSVCADPKIVYPSNNANCVNETYLVEASTPSSVSANPYAFFTDLTLGTDQYLCDGSAFTAVANTYWFTFQAISSRHLIKAICANDYVIRVLEGNDCDSLPLPSSLVVNIDPLNNPTCVEESGNTHTCITLNNLTEGNTYYIQLFVKNLTSSVSYGNVCITTPTPDSTYTYNSPAVYRWVCDYNEGGETITIPIDPKCFTQPYQFGDFSYWESIARYPDNPEIWGDLCGQPIRHFKFPDSNVSHIHDQTPFPGNPALNNKIYPIGVKINIEDIKQALNDAVMLGLITEEEKYEFTGFSIKRGNRRNNRSVIAKGLLYDVFRTPILDGLGDINNNFKFQYYSNYPYNDIIHTDPFLLTEYEGERIKHPYFNQNYINNRYVFHSPNTSFDKPQLGQELKLETVETGWTNGQTSKVEKHAEYVLLTNKAYNVAKALASLQINHEASAQAFNAGDSPAVLGTSGGAIINYIIYYVIGLATGFATNYTRYSSDWLELIKGLSTPFNPAKYLTSVGKYNNYSPVTNTGFKRRIVTNGRYLNSGNYEFPDAGETLFFNNYERESTVFLSIANEFFASPNSFSPVIDSSKYAQCSLSERSNRNISSYYASIKDYKPDQYGTVDQIEWLDTGYCGTIDWENTQDSSCETIFGGDTYINRFAIKRKMPFFIQDVVSQAEDTPVMYKDLFNVGFPRYFFNSLQDQSSLDKFNLPFLAPPNVQLDNTCEDNLPFYYRGSFYLYNYGIPYYICESDYNVDLRNGEGEGDYKDFYPHVGDVIQWTQQYKNPISFDNTYYYNVDYSKQNRENFFYILKNSYSNNLSESRAYYPNRAIYSKQDVINWKQYLAADYYDFPFEDGKLIFLNGVEKDRVVVRQENSTKVFNAYITQQSSLETVQISVGDMFATKPQEYYKSDLGFGGSNHRAFVSTPFGHFYVDSQNPSIFNLYDGLKDITRDSETNTKIQWFTENLPFNIIKDFPNVDIDNNFKYFGITLNWDNKYERLFVTKKDYRVKKEFKNLITYTNNEFYYDNSLISPTDSKYFEDESWTIAYSPLIRKWISFYSFKPNYYISTEQYFSSGVNYSNDALEIGVWNHLLTNKSYQTFYGKPYPFILEYSEKSNFKSNILSSISVNVDFQRWQNDLNFYKKELTFYDKGEIYNQNQATGYLTFIPKLKNNLHQLLLNNKVVNNATNVLTENIENFWNFNAGLYDRHVSNQPLYIYKDNPYKELNPLAISYIPTYLPNQLRSDWFAIRLQNDKTAYRIEHRFSTTTKNNSNI